MNYSKQIRLWGLFILMAFSSGMNVMAQSLVVWQKDGSCVLYTLDERPKTTFDKNVLIITTTKVRVEYPLEKVKRYTYDMTNGINDANEQRGVTVRQTNDGVVLYHLAKGKWVAVYSTDGKRLLTCQSNGKQPTSLSLKSLPAGTYLIKTDSITYKILKR